MDGDDTELIERFHSALKILEGCGEFKWLIPEVRSNLVYAREDPKSVDDILAVDGRITVVDDRPYAAGKPRFGASSHMARLILEVRKTDPSIRAGLNFANNPEFSRFLKQYCGEKGWVFSVMDRSSEPEEVKEREEGSMPWKVAQAIKAADGKVPKVFYETGAVGKEPVTVLIGQDPVEVVNEVCVIAREYNPGEWVR